MNKKIIFCFFTALVVLTFKTDSSYSIPTISKYDENYWTPEKMKRAKPLTTKKIRFRKRSGVEPIRNTTDFLTSVPPLGSVANAHVNQFVNYPIGKLFMSKNGEDYTCSASLINTDNGNIGVTAAHCLYDHTTQSYFDNIMFSPGYDNGQNGPLGRIPAAQVVVTIEFLNNDDNEFDWGMLRLDFNMNGHPLQYFSGALGWQLQPGDNIPTTFRGYPNGGKLPNCPNDDETLCTWQGVTKVANDYYVVQDLEMGEGASGGPYIMNYDPNVNLGLLYSNYASFDEIEDQGLAPIYDIAEFNSLIGELTPANN